MTVEFEESRALADTYHARLGGEAVGLLQRAADGRWHATVYRPNGDDWQASMAQRHLAEAFIRVNASMPVLEGG